MQITKMALAVVIVLPVLSFGVVTASPAAADCERAGGISLCSEGAGGKGASVALPYYPYPCEDDWLCADGGLSLLDSGGLNATRDTPGGSYLD
jgi:hypothetical protein